MERHFEHPARLIVAALAFPAALACSGDVERPYEERPASPGQVLIHQPESLESLRSEMTDANGEPVRIRCESCHSIEGVAQEAPERAENAGGPHVGLSVDHGERRCVACHDPAAPHRLRLASGESLPMTEAFQLCQQCHGPQTRDYLHGSHGGVQGAWDVSRGDQTRNHCVDCHDPHQPAFPRFAPMPPPHDRFPPAPPAEDADHG